MGTPSDAHQLALNRSRDLVHRTLKSASKANKNIGTGFVEEQRSCLQWLREHLHKQSQWLQQSVATLEAVDRSQKRLGLCLKRIRCLRFTNWNALGVCSHRLILRDGRPEPEMLWDEPQILLEQEWQSLTSWRDDLLKAEEDAERLWAKLLSIRPELTKDCAQRRQAVKAFTGAVCTAAKASFYSQLVDEEAQLTVKQDPESLLQRANALTKQCRDFCTSGNKMVAAITEQQEEAGRKSMEMLRFRCEETEEAVRALRLQVMDVDHGLARVDQCLQKGGRKISAVDEEEVQQFKETVSLFEELHANRDELQITLNNKSALLAIDQACKKTTPLKVKDDNTEAMLQKRRSLPVGRLRPTSAPQLGTLRSASEPSEEGQSPLDTP
eukprot:CAMPEP_0178420132 /NCGR_PEP_ID=MMETSP0689_2-20121128/25972_1 /TAXON_ID=160604 /ORGANISM="Amphidinium massartii, Strain CS-259" /LENGTH=382 /DNA_ID=CAMNT_0020041599 /DNA_START=21 /DNA_END=1165 /DNA_ORIENTATION=+